MRDVGGPTIMRPSMMSSPLTAEDFWTPRYRLTGHRRAVERVAKKLLDKLPERVRIEVVYSQWTPKHTCMFTVDGIPNGLIVCKPEYPKQEPLPAHRGVRLHKKRQRRSRR